MFTLLYNNKNKGLFDPESKVVKGCTKSGPRPGPGSNDGRLLRVGSRLLPNSFCRRCPLIVSSVFRDPSALSLWLSSRLKLEGDRKGIPCSILLVRT